MCAAHHLTSFPMVGSRVGNPEGKAYLGCGAQLGAGGDGGGAAGGKRTAKWKEE